MIGPREKRVCESCNWRGVVSQILTGPSPFDATDIVIGCPRCRAVNTIRTACDHVDCWEPDTCGTPTPQGYRRTCGLHLP